MKKLPIEQCWLYAIVSPKDLARRLSTSHDVLTVNDLNQLAADAGNFNVFMSIKNGKKRQVQQPRQRLQRLHRRIHDLLSRIETPDYLHSAIAGHSYITNASAHEENVPSIKIDVKKFFPSVPRGAVFEFFVSSMRCSRDVAGLLANLLTYQGHLPTGGSASPIIAYYAFKKMFDAIEVASLSRGLVMTCYVDDVTITGVRASRGLLQQIRSIIASHGLKSHKVKFLAANRPKVITGVVVTRNGLRVPNRRQLAISEGFRVFENAIDDAAKSAALNKLLGRIHEAGQIEPKWKARAQLLQRARRQPHPLLSS